MNIEIDIREIIPLENFELGWRFDKTHNPDISESEKELILALSEDESKRLNKIIAFFENENYLDDKYSETDWMSASSENQEKVEKFRNQLEVILRPWNEDILVSWQRKTVLKTTKEIFLKYWTDFLYASSDNVIIISEKTNWILFYRHFEVANVWTFKE
ncbi:DUF2947 family protein [Epilithonimonas arachidiradicis]|uniref:DUF2947 family protein n=1 Tax=Epilithonimonas arachidiradicis TaxID=1617282 RepID=A0A420CY92_9FLAO|nr:DUF2947 family protein [Epilithonimonas arachidiradicis]RKE83186.1 Protein of unknown function (DUF2947) [Epilithonimonas arachidiradicis]GGG65560.1 hypothetical protein GCM10007332_30120 [Epilithonimonas arachidiradicis]